jgi:hypothetical protein
MHSIPILTGARHRLAALADPDRIIGGHTKGNPSPFWFFREWEPPCWNFSKNSSAPILGRTAAMQKKVRQPLA